MKGTFQLGSKWIGENQPVYVIAEAGVNHNGDLKTALELVQQAKNVGADCVKFQTFKAEALVTKHAPKAQYQLKVTDPHESQFEMLKKLELDRQSYRKIISACKELGIQFLSTPYNFDDVEFLNELGVDGFKIASGQLVELPFLRFVAKLDKPMIVSTGMATLGEVEAAVDTIRSTGNEKLVILQCTTNYPSRPEDAHLRAMKSMSRSLDVLVGYSDHTENNYTIFGSIALGAKVIEKHFTLDRKLPGPDHSSSSEPLEFAEMVLGIRTIEKALGSSVKKPTSFEKQNAEGMKRSLVTTVPLPAGTTLKKEDLAFKRPATGLSPNFLDQIIGKKIRHDIPADVPIKMSDIEWQN